MRTTTTWDDTKVLPSHRPQGLFPSLTTENGSRTLQTQLRIAQDGYREEVLLGWEATAMIVLYSVDEEA